MTESHRECPSPWGDLAESPLGDGLLVRVPPCLSSARLPLRLEIGGSAWMRRVSPALAPPLRRAQAPGVFTSDAGDLPSAPPCEVLAGARFQPGPRPPDALHVVAPGTPSPRRPPCGSTGDPIPPMPSNTRSCLPCHLGFRVFPGLPVAESQSPASVSGGRPSPSFLRFSPTTAAVTASNTVSGV